MKSQVVKRSIVIGGHKTSVSLEDTFWNCLKEIAGERNATLSHLVATIDTERERGNLSSAIRLFVLGFYRNQITEEQMDPAPPECGIDAERSLPKVAPDIEPR
jgi:predicted DNA-binding ribbon-helix-helix protein